MTVICGCCWERTALCNVCVRACVCFERCCTLRVSESQCGVQSLGRGARGGWHVSPVASDVTWFINSALLILNNPETFTPHLTCCFWPCVSQNICGAAIAASQRRRGRDTDYERDFRIKSLEERCVVQGEGIFFAIRNHKTTQLKSKDWLHNHYNSGN